MAILISDVETRESLRRVKEVNLTFGEFSPYCYCTKLEEYAVSLMQAEKLRMPFTGHGPHAAIRRNIITLLMKIADQEKLTNATLFAGIYLYDRFSDVHTISDGQIHLVAISCLIIAGKLEEKDTRTPKIKRLQHYIPESSEFSTKLFVMIEKYILEYYDFQLLLPTEVNFIEVYMLYALDGVEGIVQQETNNNMLLGRHSNLTSNSVAILQNLQSFNQQRSKITLDKVQDCCYSILQYLLKFNPNDDYPASLIAAAVLMYSRRHFGLNFWTQKLQNVTTYSIRDVSVCLKYHLEPLLFMQRKKPHFEDPIFVVNKHTFVLE